MPSSSEGSNSSFGSMRMVRQRLEKSFIQDDLFGSYSSESIDQDLEHTYLSDGSLNSSSTTRIHGESFTDNSNHNSELSSSEEVIQRAPDYHPNPIVSDTDVEVTEIKYASKPFIAEGAFGGVYKATYLGEAVAVKQIRYANEEDAKAEQDNLDLCFNEKTIHKMLSGLSNSQQFITTIHGFMLDKTNKDFYLITSLADQSLSAFLQAGKLELKHKYSIGGEIAAAINFLHQNNVIHRDIKSDNILLKNGGIKICDFGVSTLSYPKENNNNGSNQEVKREIIGTMPWTAPEVFEKQPHTEKIDIFSLGMVLWELLTQMDPREADEIKKYELQTLFLLCMLGKMPMLSIPEEAPLPLASKIKRCWEKEPGVRPSAIELAKEFAKDVACLRK